MITQKKWDQTEKFSSYTRSGQVDEFRSQGKCTFFLLQPVIITDGFLKLLTNELPGMYYGVCDKDF